MGNKDKRSTNKSATDNEAGSDTSERNQLQTKINDLLTYTQHYLKKGSVENIRKTILRFYPEEEICEAKTILWEIFGSGGPLGKMPTRARSSTREAHEADTADILMAMQKLDSERYLDEFRFVHFDLDNVPKYAPEEGDSSVYAAQISQHEQRLAALERQEDEHKSEMATLRMMIHELTNTRKQNVSYSDILQNTVKGDPLLHCRTSEARRGQSDGIGLYQPSYIKSKINETEKQGTSHLDQEIATEQSSMSIPPNNIKLNDRELRNGRSTEEGDFQVTREERRRQRRKELHEKCVYGKREGTGLKSGPKYSDVFVFRIHSDVTNDELQEFVTNEGVVVNELKQVSKDG